MRINSSCMHEYDANRPRVNWQSHQPCTWDQSPVCCRYIIYGHLYPREFMVISIHISIFGVTYHLLPAYYTSPYDHALQVSQVDNSL
jgi:hypothetical protein